MMPWSQGIIQSLKVYYQSFLVYTLVYTVWWEKFEADVAQAEVWVATTVVYNQQNVAVLVSQFPVPLLQIVLEDATGLPGLGINHHT